MAKVAKEPSKDWLTSQVWTVPWMPQVLLTFRAPLPWLAAPFWSSHKNAYGNIHSWHMNWTCSATTWHELFPRQTVLTSHDMHLYCTSMLGSMEWNCLQLYTKAKHSDKSWEDLGQSAQTKRIHCTCLTNFSKYHPHDQCGFVQSISKYVYNNNKKLTLFQCNGWSNQDCIINCTIK